MSIFNLFTKNNPAQTSDKTRLKTDYLLDIHRQLIHYINEHGFVTVSRNKILTVPSVWKGPKDTRIPSDDDIINGMIEMGLIKQNSSLDAYEVIRSTESPNS
jgi:hypothetical protein